jgi:hypothetical protein
MALATKIELHDQTTQKLEDTIRKIVTSVLNEYTEDVGRHAASKPLDPTKGKRGKKNHAIKI